MKGTLAAMVVAIVALAGSMAASAPGMPAPDVILSADTGSTIRLSDLKGRVALLDFWASWCIPCRASFPALDTLNKELGNKGFVVIAVNVDEERQKADQFLSARPHTMTVAFDPQGKVAEAFKLRGMPSTILVDRRGTIRFTHMGYTEKTLAQFRSEILQLVGEL